MRAVLCAAALLSLRVAGAAGATVPTSPCRLRAGPENMVVVLARGASGDPAPYYSWKECSAILNAGKNYSTEPVSETRHAGNVTLIDIAGCNLVCLDHDAFDFPGASAVTKVDIQAARSAAVEHVVLAGVPWRPAGGAA